MKNSWKNDKIFQFLDFPHFTAVRKPVKVFTFIEFGKRTSAEPQGSFLLSIL